MRWGFAVLVAVVPLLQAEAAVVTVDCTGGGDYLTIQEAVDAAASGDTVLIAPCVYEEQVTVEGKALTLQGAGSDVTELLWHGNAHTLLIPEHPDGLGSRVADLSVVNVHSGPLAAALEWAGGVALERCRIEGEALGSTAFGSTPHVELHATDCSMSVLRVSGGGWSDVSGCTIGVAHYAGHFDYVNTWGQSIDSEENVAGQVHLHAVTEFESHLDEFGGTTLHGGAHSWPRFVAEDSRLGDFVALSECDLVSMLRCDVGSLMWEGEPGIFGAPLIIEDCLIMGDVQIGCPTPVDCFIMLRLVHSTILGSLDYVATGCVVWRHIRSNIVMGPASVSVDTEMVVSHNDFAGGATISALGDSVFANFEADPLFCDPAASDYTLQECSPCAAAGHDGGDVGAFDVGCPCWVPVEPASWGAIKGKYR